MRMLNMALVMTVAAIFVAGCGKEKPAAGSGDTGAVSAAKGTADLYQKFANAIYADDMETVRELADSEESLNSRGLGGESPLIGAVMMDKPEIAALLIEKGADVNIKGKTCGTALSNCVMGIKDPEKAAEIAALLIENGADINMPVLSNQTPLHLAAMQRHMPIARVLLKNNADPNVKDDGGRTPLHYCAPRGWVDMTTLLLENGADAAVKDRDGKTALDYAKDNDYKETVELLEKHGN